MGHPGFDGAVAARLTAAAFGEVREFCGGEALNAVVAWLEALMVEHQAQMLGCARERLPEVQLRLQQLAALRLALVVPGGASTGFVL